ncbi:protein phosphatase 2C domain-containing protein [Streptomyces sp. NPDC051133]|uniref:protein phosphatase 2C domain-containing protein n=1 Tax=Streptomyces sp. NPDC051133 TaxID=3155521 RepID=UPI0034236DD2
MSQQGGSPARRDDDWWGQLYDDSAEDTGPTAAPDSLDDRFSSARSAVAGRPTEPPPPDRTPDTGGEGVGGSGPPPREPSVPAQRPAPDPLGAPPAGGAAPVEPPEPVTPPPAPTEPPAPPSAPPAPLTAPLGMPESAPAPAVPPIPPPPPSTSLDYVGSGPPTYDPEPTALPAADPDDLGELVADTVLDGARYGACTLRAVSLRGDSARYRGEPRRDALLTARFGTGEQALVLVAMATGARGTPGAHLAAAEACRWIGRAVGRSHQRLVADVRAGRRGDLKSGLHRLTDRTLGRLRASAAEQGIDPEEYTAGLRCLLLPADRDCRARVFFGVGEGGLFRLRDGEWQDIEPQPPVTGAAGAPAEGGLGTRPDRTPEGDRLTMDLGIPTPPSPFEQAGPPAEPPREPFRFRASVAHPGDALVMCSAGLAEPLRGEPALCAYLARRWSGRAAPGLAAFLADVQVRVKGYADDRTAAAVWEA